MTETTDSDPFPDTAADPGAAVAVPDDDPDAGTLQVFPPAQPATNAARAMLAEHVAMLNDAWKIADVVCQTPAAPARYRGKPKEGTVAIMYGAELGLPPMASLQKIINVNGSPGLEARTMKGLLKTRGFQFRTIVKAEDEFIIHAWEPTSNKRTDPPDEVAHWTMARAIKARYVPIPSSDDSLRRPDVDDDWVTVTKTWEGRSKKSVLGNMKYITDPVGMLEAKGTADVCRAIAPEILMGLPYAAEERDEWTDEPDAPPSEDRRQGTKGVNRLRERAAQAAGRGAGQQFAEHVDAEVVDDEAAAESFAEANPHNYSQTAPGPAPGPEPAPPKEPDEPAPAPTTAEPDAGDDGAPEQAGDGMAADKGGRGPAATGTPPPSPALNDLEMSAQNRAKGEAMLSTLLNEGGLGDAAIADRLAVVAEIATKQTGATFRPIERFPDLTNYELKHVVDVLRKHRERGKLFEYVGEALNAASLREAGLTDD